jgi:peptidoglycan hydrolase-like protein with peptidoglycan-binding domain
MAIKVGDRGTAVRTLQDQLRRSGFNPGGTDGVFGTKTAEAVRRFQSANGLTVDAKVGRDTQRALTAARNRDSFEPAPAARTTATQRRGEGGYRELKRFAEDRGFVVTSTTGGRHLGRAHREGRAVDVRTRDHTTAQGNTLIRQARAAGYTVIDERRGGNAAWSGPHIHIQM